LQLLSKFIFLIQTLTAMLRLSPILFTCGLIVFLSSCQKELDDTGGGSVSGNFKAKIDGTWWVANKSATANKTFGFITLTGISSDKKALRILLLDSGVHNYTVDPGSVNTAIFIDSSLATITTFTSNQATLPGQVNITAIDTANKTMSGTFSFKVHNQSDTTEKNFTEGSFTNISYSSSLPIGGNPTDTFQVKIGTASLWSAPVVLGIGTGGQLAITGSDPTASRSVAILMSSTITPGNYNFSLTGTTLGIYTPDADPNNIKISSLGILTILEHNVATKRIRGNFNFTASDIMNPLNFVLLTQGYFSVTYN
jgi:hypothetical protein